ncbi:uracil-DNA glycosylase [Curtobacterium sp. MCBA15_004]|uniref:uracil-DNA glycosylase n=1 Tax=unclassified Curtobacterium TaxID=257496 RepID=UPI0027349431|nr:uracil-DNA glycosylase [Curtobacterium sp. MCBA15_004]WIA98051.1 uracil-DNA glycosylase [Curtobacterium sp. MCBA15_004]
MGGAAFDGSGVGRSGAAGSGAGGSGAGGSGSPSGFDGFWAALDAVPVAEDAEALYDVSTAAGRLRRENLSRYLAHVGPAADTVLVAEAPGWRGMTNTGIPFTSMRELGSLGFDVLEPEEPTAPWEASSRVVQAALRDWSGPLPLTWAIFPHHPFVAPDRLTNRTPRPAEVRAGAPVALALLDALGGGGTGAVDATGAGAARPGLRPVRVVAVGRKAQGALALAGIDAVAVRHPAQGGAAQFTEQVRALQR